jgi:hypothetical protein
MQPVSLNYFVIFNESAHSYVQPWEHLMMYRRQYLYIIFSTNITLYNIVQPFEAGARLNNI